MTCSTGARAARANRPPDAGRRLHRRGKRNCHYQRLPRRAVDRPALGVQTGDIVAVESPSFHGTMQMLRGFDIKAIEIPTDPETGISIEALELALEQWPIKAVIPVPNCNNPLGFIMPEARKKQVLAPHSGTIS